MPLPWAITQSSTTGHVMSEIEVLSSVNSVLGNNPGPSVAFVCRSSRKDVQDVLNGGILDCCRSLGNRLLSRSASLTSISHLLNPYTVRITVTAMHILIPYLSLAQACSALFITEDIGIQQHVQAVSPPELTSSLLQLHEILVKQPSISGSEAGISVFLQDYLQDKGFTVYTQNVEPGRDNIFAFLGESKKTRILVTSHIDTVPPFWPYARRGDEIWGRGTVDAKGSVASQIIAVEELVKAGKIDEGDVALLFVVGEENSGAGMKAANNLGLSWEMVIFGEPTDLKLARGHKGGIGFVLEAKGKAGHSGYPEQGNNAIDILVDALSALRLVEFPSSERFGNTTVNIGQIEGGVAPNVIPEKASATVSVRIAAGTPAEIQNIIKKAIDRVSPDLRVTFSGGRGSVPIDNDIEGDHFTDWSILR